MGLSRYKVAATLAVSDMDRAREFYEGTLSLSVGIDSDEDVQYRCAEGSVMHVYLSRRSTPASLRRRWPAGASTTSRRS
jgi:catechol-2,3-dioxygenase